ncbi:MAG: hypothetical protein KKF26_03610 [Chloroflexi bacterium]|nr:hypothetical protein [Chloroflexota bacterium]
MVILRKGEVYTWQSIWGRVYKHGRVISSAALLVLVSILLLLASCSSGQSMPTTSEAPVSANATPQREFPSFAYNSAQVLQAYKTAVQIPELLPLMPCYCNCGEAHGHKSLKDCFFKEDGSLNDHGAFCEVCDMEVADLAKWQGEGYSLEQIRGLIEEKYHDYGKPTDTAPFVHIDLETTPKLTISESTVGPGIFFDEDSVDTWNVPLGARISYSFHFKNVGENPLTVTDTWAGAMDAC